MSSMCCVMCKMLYVVCDLLYVICCMWYVICLMRFVSNVIFEMCDMWCAYVICDVLYMNMWYMYVWCVYQTCAWNTRADSLAGRMCGTVHADLHKVSHSTNHPWNTWRTHTSQGLPYQPAHGVVNMDQTRAKVLIRFTYRLNNGYKTTSSSLFVRSNHTLVWFGN